MTKTTAKLFMHGRSQAVRLPKEFRMAGTEVEITKSGDVVTSRPILAEKTDWKPYLLNWKHSDPWMMT
jgi:antitoxin VapB